MGLSDPTLNVLSKVLREHRAFVDALVVEKVNQLSDHDRTKTYTIPTFSSLCNRNPEILEAYENAYKWRFPTSGHQGELSSEMMAYQGMATDTPFFALNLTSGDFSLYSGNPEHLALFKGGDKFDKSKTYDLLQEGIVNAMRLDVDYYNVRGGYTVKATKLINAKAGDRRLNVSNFIFVPMTIIDRLILMLTTFMRKGRVVKIVSDDSGALKDHFVSMNPNVIEEYNGHSNPLEYIDFRYVGRVYVPVVGAPIYSTGLTRIEFSALDEVTVTRQSDINIEPANNSPEQLIQDEVFSKFLELVFMERYAEQKKKIWDLIVLLGGVVPYDAHRYSYLRAIRSLGADARMALWSKLPDDFKNYANQMSQVIRGYEPYVGEISVPALRNVLRKGVYKIVMLKSNGTFSSVIATNNEEMLKIAYGPSYQQKYEHDDFRLGKFFNDVNNGMPEVEAMKKWNMLEASYVKDTYDTETSDEEALASALYAWAEKSQDRFIENLDEDRVYSSYHEKELTVRKLFSSNGIGESFYRKIPIQKIYQVSRLG